MLYIKKCHTVEVAHPAPTAFMFIHEFGLSHAELISYTLFDIALKIMSDRK